MSASVHHQSVAMQEASFTIVTFYDFCVQGQNGQIILSDGSLEAPANATASGASLLEGLKSAACASFSPLASWPKSSSILSMSHAMRIFFAVRMCCMNSMCFMYPSCAQVPHAGSNPNAQMDPSCLRLSFLLSKAFIIIPSPTSLLLCSEKCRKDDKKT